MRRFTRSLTAVLIVGALVVGATACGGDDSAENADPVDYSVPGPYPVGITTLQLADREVFMFYPADPDRLAEGTPVASYSSGDAFPAALRAAIPAELVQDVDIDATRDAPIADDGPFPVVIHSHGFGGYPQFASLHLIHLASWGFVSAAPNHLERNLAANSLGTVTRTGQDVRDLRATLDLLTEQNASGPFAESMDLEQVAAEGHSAGGAAAGRFAYDPQVVTWIGQAPAAPLDAAVGGSGAITDLAAAYAAQAPPDKPSMLIAAEVDLTIPLASIETQYEWLSEPKRFAVIGRAGHNAFTDLCGPIREQGGLLQYAGRLPAPENLLRLGEDGCTEANLEVETGYAIINHLTVAQLRWVFGLDPTAVSLSTDFVESLFPGMLTQYRSAPADTK